MRAAWRDVRAHGTLRIHPLSPRTRAQVLTLRQVKALKAPQTHLATALRELGFVVYRDRAGEPGLGAAVHDDRSLAKNMNRLYAAAVDGVGDVLGSVEEAKDHAGEMAKLAAASRGRDEIREISAETRIPVMHVPRVGSRPAPRTTSATRARGSTSSRSPGL